MPSNDGVFFSEAQCLKKLKKNYPQITEISTDMIFCVDLWAVWVGGRIEYPVSSIGRAGNALTF